MCIKRVTAWAYAGRNYDSEQEAVWAAIEAAGRKITKDFSANPGRGLIEDPDLPGLLIRYQELRNGADNTPAESTEGTRSEEPEGTRDRLDRVVTEMRADREEGRDFLTKYGFKNLPDFAVSAKEADMDKWDSRHDPHNLIPDNAE